MLCGLYKPTSGRALVAGFDLSSDLSSIHQVMGVCPQHDVLWNDLTAREHLIFFARLRKVLPPFRQLRSPGASSCPAVCVF